MRMPKLLCTRYCIQILILTVWGMLPITRLYAQRAFLTSVDHVNRTYYLRFAHKDEQQANVPLVFIVSDTQKKSPAVAWPDSLWATLQTPAIIVFPMAQGDAWDCANAAFTQNNVDFIHEVIDGLYNDFRVDRNRVFFLTEGENACFVKQFKDQYPSLVAGSESLQGEDVNSPTAHLDKLKKFTGTTVKADTTYALWVKPPSLIPKKRSPEDSIKRITMARRFTISIRRGTFLLLGSSKTFEEDDTYMDLAKAHTMLSLDITKWMTDSTGWFLDLNRLKVPQKMKATYSGLSVETGGGTVMAITAGFKYALYRHKTRPYFMLGTGPMSVMVMGGRVSNTVDPDRLMSVMDAEMRMTFHTMVGAGVSWRFGKRVFVDANARYFHSGKFDSAGQAESMRGFDLGFSTGFIFGANKSITSKH